METRAEQAQGQAVESPGAQATEELACPDAKLYARFFRVLGDPTRIRILHLLLSAPPTGRTVSERVERLVQPQGRVSTRLGCLRWCGLVESERSGKPVSYRLADPRVRDILTLGEAVMRDHAAGVASCGVIR
jgi:DNA-binding transcriptional ArsR family regulator